jgi:hypothetical protein
MRKHSEQCHQKYTFGFRIPAWRRVHGGFGVVAGGTTIVEDPSNAAVKTDSGTTVVQTGRSTCGLHGRMWSDAVEVPIVLHGGARPGVVVAPETLHGWMGPSVMAAPKAVHGGMRSKSVFDVDAPGARPGDKAGFDRASAHIGTPDD